MWALYGKSNAPWPTTTVGQPADAVAGIAEHKISIARVDYVKRWSDPKLDVAPAYTRIFARFENRGQSPIFGKIFQASAAEKLPKIGL